MSTLQTIDAGKALHSPSAEFMELVNVQKGDATTWTTFDDVVTFLTHKLYKIIDEVHHDFDKLLIDNGQVQLNIPPAAEPGDSHGSLLLRSLSEQTTGSHNGIVARREFRVHDLKMDVVEETEGNWVEIRENVVRAASTSNGEAGAAPAMEEHVAKVCIPRGTK